MCSHLPALSCTIAPAIQPAVLSPESLCCLERGETILVLCKILMRGLCVQLFACTVPSASQPTVLSGWGALAVLREKQHSWLCHLKLVMQARLESTSTRRSEKFLARVCPKGSLGPSLGPQPMGSDQITVKHFF